MGLSLYNQIAIFCVYLNVKKILRQFDNVIRLDINRVLREVWLKREVQEFILNLNRIDQIFLKGIQSDGSPITSTNSTPGAYSYFTQQFHLGETFTFQGFSRQKIYKEPYFLFDTNEYFYSFLIEIATDGFLIDALKNRDDTNMLDEYGSELLGLTKESISKLAIYILPLIQTITLRETLK